MNSIALNRPCPQHKQSLFARIRSVLSVRRQRQQLARLDTRALNDIGITRAQADAEARRPIWDAPQFWKSCL
ncbi:DUF1127 domain-containing protein [Ruegeria profundi]|uniref:DUF1127 domain-containing protein n=1 Tax=Ruegeria profundi TaxID=1685378 RepID=UPI00147C8060